jgi:hypothetical protein
MRLITTKRREARQRYREFITDGMPKQAPVDLSTSGLVRSYAGWEALMSAQAEQVAGIGEQRILVIERQINLKSL